MKIMTNFFFIFSIITIPFTFQQTLTSLIKEGSALGRTIDDLEDNIKKFTTYKSYKIDEKRELVKELRLISAEYDEEKIRFQMFGILNEETVYNKSFRDYYTLKN